MKKPKILFLGVDGAMPSYVKEQIAKGNLPNFKRLIEGGVFFEDCMTVYPSISPTCWNSIYTGAVPKVHGGTCESIHRDGTNPWNLVTSYHSSNIKAEKFWEAAAKKGYKSLILAACSSGPAKTDNVNQIFGGVSQTPDKRTGDTYVSGIPQQFFHINTGEEKVILSITGAKNKGALFETDSVDLPQGKELEKGVFEFKCIKGSKCYNPREIEDVSWVVIPSHDGVKIGADVESARASDPIGVGEWTKPITRILNTDEGPWPFHFRARLDEMDAENGRYVIFIPATKNLVKEVQHRKDAELIKDIAEVHSVYAGLDGLGVFDQDKYFECHAFDCDWRKQVIAKNLEAENYDIVFDYIGFVDTVNHCFRPAYEGYDIYKNLDLDKDDPRIESAHIAMERCYKLVDEHLGWLLDNVVGEDTNVCVISDHGSVGYRDDYNQHIILEQAGLITYNTDQYWSKIAYIEDRVDWTKTKAYPVGCGNIFVNLEGREPCGIVKKEDYKKVVAEIIDALHTYGRDRDGFPCTAFAVPNDQAGFVGQGGPDTGDVIYGMLGGEAGGYNGGVHAQQIPSAKNENGGNIRSFCVMSGTGFKKGVSLSRPIDLTDVAPTMCYATGFPQPADATGGVIFQALKEE